MSASDSAAPEAPPLDDAAFARLIAPLGPFERRPTVAVAVSGGPDSLALALLGARWADAHGGRAVALTVDHRLRPESGAQTAQGGRWLGGPRLAPPLLPRDTAARRPHLPRPA